MTDTSSSLSAQPVSEALISKSTSTMQFLSSWHVGGLAVDWFTGNVYVTETEREVIAMARYDNHDPHMYRVILRDDLHRPTTVALDPYAGLVLPQGPHYLTIMKPPLNLPLKMAECRKLRLMHL